VRQAPATIASSVTYLTPVFAVVVGVAFLGESLSWNEPVGALLILVGAALAQDRLHRRPLAANDESELGPHPGADLNQEQVFVPRRSAAM